MKKCKGCYYRVEDMCSYWRMWRKDVVCKECSETFVRGLDKSRKE